MKKLTVALLVFAAVAAVPYRALAVGKVQRQGVKTLADCVAGGATGANCLIGDDQIWDHQNSQQLSVSIATGALGGGGGGGGINLLTNSDNPGFETGGQTPWFTNAPSQVTMDSVTPIYGTTSAVLSANGTGQWLRSAIKSLSSSNGLAGNPCLAMISYKYSGSNGDYSLQVLDGSTVLVDVPLAHNADPIDQPAAFTCPSTSSMLQLRVISNVSSPQPIEFDGAKANGGNAQLGSNILTKDFGVASFYGSAKTPSTASCFWTATGGNGVWTDFPVVSACPVPTVSGKVSAPSTKIPAFSANFEPGEYLVIANMNASTGSTTMYRLYDGTNGSGSIGGVGGSFSQGSLVGHFTYDSSTAGVHEIRIQVSGDGGTTGVNLDANNTNEELTFYVYKYPTQAASSLSTVSNSSKQGEFTLTGCSSGPTTSSTSFADFSIPSGCTLNTVSGNVTASIGATSAGEIDITPTRVGQTLEVCATATLGTGGAGSNGYVSILDNQGTNKDQVFASATSAFIPFHLCAQGTSTSLSAMPFKLQGASPAAGPIYLQGPAVGTTNLKWTVKDISESHPMTYLVQQIQSPSTANMIHATALVACRSGTCSVTRQDGTWLSVAASPPATGKSDLTFSAFSSTPNCTVSAAATGGEVSTCQPTDDTTPTSTNLRVQCARYDGVLQNRDYFISCTGPR